MDLVNKVCNQESAIQTLKWCISMGDSHNRVTQRMLEQHFRSSYKLADVKEDCVEMLFDLVSRNNHLGLRQFLQYVDRHLLQTVPTDSKKSLSTKLLISAAESGFNDVCGVLAKAGADVNVQYHGKPLFAHALVLGHIDVAKALVKEGADINALDNKGDNVMVHVLTSSIQDENKTAALKWLCDNGIDPNKPTTRGKYPIHIAAGQAGSSIDHLLDLNCDVNIPDVLNGDSPLHIACAMCCENSVKKLVKRGAKINMENLHGETPLYKLLKFAQNYSNFHAKSRVSLGRTLVLLGFRMPKQKQPEQNDRKKQQSRDKVYDVYNRVTKRSCQALNLQELCRTQVIDSFTRGKFSHNVQNLTLPTQLKNFLMFHNDIHL